MIQNLHISKLFFTFAQNFKSVFMIKDFYIRYGASKCKLLYVLNIVGKRSFKFYKCGSKFVIVKDRNICVESSDIRSMMSYFRNLVFLELPFSDELFN